jgi:hypothetical protein
LRFGFKKKIGKCPAKDSPEPVIPHSRGPTPPIYPTVNESFKHPLTHPRKRIKSEDKSHIFRNEIPTPVKAKI